MKTITLIFIGLTWSCFSQTDFVEKFDLKPKSQKDILPDNPGLLISESKSGACSNTSEGTIGLEDCSYIGTATFNTIKKLPLPMAEPLCCNQRWFRILILHLIVITH